METERPGKNQRRLSDWLINRQSESVEACFKRFFPIERSRGLSAVSVFSSDSVKKVLLSYVYFLQDTLSCRHESGMV